MAFVAEHVVIVGGAGFVGSHFVDHFLTAPITQRVTIFDNFTSGRPGTTSTTSTIRACTSMRGDVKDLAGAQQR